MKIKKRIINSLSHQSLEEVILEQNFILSIITELNQFFPKKYRKINLMNMILVKTYGYHTLFKEVYNHNKRCQRIFKNLIFHDHLSKKFANMRTLSAHRNLNKILCNNKEEAPYKFIFEDKKDYSKIFSSNLSWNIFSTNMQSYLHVLIKTIKHSDVDNNLLLIPKEFSELRVIKNIDSNKIIYFDDFVTEEIINKNNLVKEEFKNIYKKNKENISNLLTISNLSYFDLLEDGIKNVFYNLIPQSILFYNIYNNIHRKIKIRSIVGCRVRRTFDRVSFTFAKNNDINSYLILHSTLQPDINELYSTGYFNDINGIFTWGENHKNYLTQDPKLSYNSTIHTFGSPLFDYKEIKKKKTNDKVILFAAGKDNFKEIKLLIKTINSINQNIKLLIKGHPSQNSEKYESLINKYVDIIPYTHVIENYYNQSDILITAYSGAHLTAMIEKIPVIFFAINSQTIVDLKSIYGLGDNDTKKLIALNKSILKKKITKVLFDSDYESSYLNLQNKYINKSISTKDNAESVARKINKIINLN